MTIYLKSVLAGSVAMLLGFVIYVVGTSAVMSVVLERQMRAQAQASEGGALVSAAVSVPNYYLPFGAIVVFALGFLWMLRRQRRRLRTTA